MTVVSTTLDRQALTLTSVTELAASPLRVWQIWSDPRQLERWWGPPTWPATFTEHDLTVDATTKYFMTGPDGRTAHGWWRILTAHEPSLLEFQDGFADDTGAPDPSMPTSHARVELVEAPQGTRMTLTSTFADLAQLEQLAEMGMVEGLTSALGQIDGILAAG